MNLVKKISGGILVIALTAGSFIGARNAEVKHEYTKIIGTEITYDGNLMETYGVILECNDGKLFGHELNGCIYGHHYQIAEKLYHELDDKLGSGRITEHINNSIISISRNRNPDIDVSYRDFFGLRIKNIELVSK